MKAFLGILGRSWVFLSRLGPSLGVLEASWRRLGAVWGRLGAVLARLGPSWAVLGASWAVLGASWGLLAAKTHQKRGGPEFWRPLGTVLASFLKGFLIFFRIL